jgi:hypothetical protein
MALSMPLKNDRYTYRVTWSEDDPEYAGLCTEFKSLSWLDKTPEAALKGIREMMISSGDRARRALAGIEIKVERHPNSLLHTCPI